MFFPAGTWQTDCFLRIVHGQKEGQQRRKIPGIREASRESGDESIISTFSSSHPQSTFQNILSPRSSIPQDYHVPPFHPCLASRKTSTQTMARSAVDESSTTPLWPFRAAKLRLIAIPQLARDGHRGQEGSPKGTFEVEVGCFLVQKKYILN